MTVLLLPSADTLVGLHPCPGKLDGLLLDNIVLQVCPLAVQLLSVLESAGTRRL